MTLKPSMNPSVMTVHCQRCLEELTEGQTPLDNCHQQVGVTATGDLVVWCLKHDEPIAMHKQGMIDAQLLEIVSQPCVGCGKVHAQEDKEKLH